MFGTMGTSGWFLACHSPNTLTEKPAGLERVPVLHHLDLAGQVGELRGDAPRR